MIQIKQDPRKVMDVILKELTPGNTGYHPESAIHYITTLYSDLKDTPVEPEELARFKESFSALITERQNFISLLLFLDLCANYAERGRFDGFNNACWMRTIAQLIDDEFMNWEKYPSQKELFMEDIEYIDEAIEDVSDDAPPVLEDEIPDWAPESHWWWRAPKRQDMSEAERRDRLEYETRLGWDD